MANKIKRLALKVQEIALCFARNWWRPITQWGLALAVLVNTVYLPVKKGESVDLSQLALLVGAFAPIIAVRAWEKSREPSTP